MKPLIVIIDDDPNLRKTLSDILRAKGYETLAAKDGAEGLTMLEQNPVNLAIIDLMLPDMSGLEVLDRIKAARPATETIILTGHAALESAIEATNKGAFSYLQKPYEVDQLMLHIRHAIEKQQAHEKLRLAAEEWQVTFDAISEGVSVHDLNMTIVKANRWLCGLLGVSREEIIGKRCYHAFHDAEEAVENCPLNRSVLSKRAEHLEFFERSLERWLSVSCFPIVENDVLTGAVHVVRDITERKQAEKDLQRHLDELERLNKLMVGREVKMEELRKKMRELEARLESVRAKEGSKA